MAKLFLLFTLVPFVEFYLLLRLAGFLGLGGTILLVVSTGAIGAFLARAEGLRFLRQAQKALAAGQVPEEGVTSGLLLLVGGVLLVTPGVITDALGLFLLLPGGRNWVATRVQRWFERSVQEGRIHVYDASDSFMGGAPPPREEGESIRDVNGEVIRRRPPTHQD